MAPLVSILIPAYNAQEWIAETIQSAIEQTWERKEIIVVDDGSNDNTLAVARRFVSETVVVLSQGNQGSAAARNQAFAKSKGDYIQWLDADDLLAPEKIAKQMAVVNQERNPRALYSGPWGHFMYRFNRAEFKRSQLWCDLSPAEWLRRKMIFNLHMQTATWLVSRELTVAAGPWDTSLLTDDDGEYFCRVLLNSDGVRFIEDAKVFYRLPGTRNVSYIGRSNRKMDDQFRSIKLHIGYILSLEDTEEVRAACLQYIQNWLIHFYPERMDIVCQADKLAEQLGGRLGFPHLTWKYSLILRFFGWDMTKRAQILFPRVRWSFVRRWDRLMYNLGRRMRVRHENHSL